MSRTQLSKSTFLKGEETLAMLAVCHVHIILNLSSGSFLPEFLYFGTQDCKLLKRLLLIKILNKTSSVKMQQTVYRFL